MVISNYVWDKDGENSQIPRFGKICGKLTLFQKYLTIYHFFITRVPQNQVLHSTRFQWTQVPNKSPAWHYWPKICVIKKIMWYSISLKSSFFIVLELHTVEYLVFLFFFSFFLFPFSTFCFCWNGLNSQS